LRFFAARALTGRRFRAAPAPLLQQMQPQPAPFVPPSVAAIPSDVLVAQHRGTNLRTVLPQQQQQQTQIMPSPAQQAGAAARCVPVLL
jgi:hypothetical protein